MIKIVTPVSRIFNLLEIEKSFGNIDLSKFEWVVIIDKSVENHFFESGIELKFAKVIFSPISNALVGHAHRNLALNLFSDSEDWIMFLDDDTILCQEYPILYDLMLESELTSKTAFVINQVNKDFSPRLFANIEMISVCNIDMGQYCFKINSVPNQLRFNEFDYCADGIFIEDYKKIKGSELIAIFNSPNVFSIYNYLR